MASRMYPSGKAALLGKLIDFDSDDIRAVLLRSTHTYNSANDNLDDIASGDRASVTGNLSGKTITNGQWDVADFSFTSVTGADCNAVLFYLHTGTESTSKLIAYVDGFTVTPDGNNITVTVDANGVLELTD